MTKTLDKLQKMQETELQEAREGEPVEPQATDFPTPRGASAQSEVFSINFLRGDIVPLRVRRITTYVALGYLGVNILLLSSLIGMAFSSQAKWQKLQTGPGGDPSATSLSTLRQEMETIHEQALKDLSQLNTVIAQQKQQFPVGGKLAALAKTLPTRTWITGLSGDREGHRLTIQATYLVNPEKPYDLPTKKWIEALRADRSFGQNLKRIDLGSSSQKMQGKAEVCFFELVAEWER